MYRKDSKGFERVRNASKGFKRSFEDKKRHSKTKSVIRNGRNQHQTAHSDKERLTRSREGAWAQRKREANAFFHGDPMSGAPTLGACTPFYELSSPLFS